MTSETLPFKERLAELLPEVPKPGINHPWTPPPAYKPEEFPFETVPARHK